MLVSCCHSRPYRSKYMVMPSAHVVMVSHHLGAVCYMRQRTLGIMSSLWLRKGSGGRSGS